MFFTFSLFPESSFFFVLLFVCQNPSSLFRRGAANAGEDPTAKESEREVSPLAAETRETTQELPDALQSPLLPPGADMEDALTQLFRSQVWKDLLIVYGLS